MYQVSRPLGLILSDLTRDKIFRSGLALKITLIILLVPTIQHKLFVPFILNTLSSPELDPWGSFLAKGGDPLAFPYGPVMFLAHLPTTFTGWLIDVVTGYNYFALLGFRVSLLLADLLVLVLLLRMFEQHWMGILIFYWLSPLVIFISYWHGQTDIVPVAFLLTVLHEIRREKMVSAGALMALAVAAKYSMIIALPFILIYFWLSGSIRKHIPIFIVSLSGVLFVVGVPWLLSDGFREMVLATREAGKLYWLSIKMGENLFLYLTPMTYLFLLYFTWQSGRMNFELLLVVMGVAFSIIILQTPASPGWYLWIVPALVLHQVNHGTNVKILVGLFSIFFIVHYFLHATGSVPFFFGVEGVAFNGASPLLGMRLESIIYTLFVTLGLVISLQILRKGVQGNDYYLLGRRPLSIAIAGDSGVGKSLFSQALAQMFGKLSIVEIEGDDYHNWDRSSPMWKSITHLEPRANRLFEMVKDVQKLLNGEAVSAHVYDHSTGRFLPRQPRMSKQIVLVSGLHALYPKQLAEEMNIRFFLEMDEELRIHFKIKRDVFLRAYDEERVRYEIARRVDDSRKYIAPQAERADVVFRIQAVNQDLLSEVTQVPKLKLIATLKSGIYYQELLKVLIGVCGLHVNIVELDEKGEVILDIEGEVSPEDVRLAAFKLVPHLDELVDSENGFESSVLGTMQLIALVEINEEIKRRRRKW